MWIAPRIPNIGIGDAIFLSTFLEKIRVMEWLVFDFEHNQSNELK